MEIEGRLMNVRPANKEIILEMQSGLRSFQALIPDSGNMRQSIPPIGSELRLRGIVATRSCFVSSGLRIHERFIS